MKVFEYIILIIVGLFLESCSRFDPEIPVHTSYDKHGLPVITVDNYERGALTTMTTASLAWKMEAVDPSRIKKLYLCYKNYDPEIPADTTDYKIDLLPLLNAGKDTIRLTGLHRSSRYHFRPYVEMIDTSGYMSYEFLNHFSTKADVCEAAWKKINSFPGGGAGYNSTFSFSFDGKGYAGLAQDDSDMGKMFDPSFWVYDPQLGEWTRKANFPGPPRWNYISFSIGGKGYIGLGIKKENGMFSDLFKDFWEYDTYTDQWKQLADFPGIYRSDAFSFAMNGKGYVLKGVSFYQDIKEMWEYDPTTDSWRERTCIPGGMRLSSTVFVLNNMAYVVGGYNGAGQDLCDLWQYDSKADIWSRKADFPGGGRSDMFVFAFDSVAILGEGTGEKLYDQCMWQYNPSVDRWQEKRNAPIYLQAYYLNFTLSGKGYTANSRVAIYEYNPLIDNN